MYSRRIPFFALVLLLAAVTTLRADEVDDHVKAEMRKQHIPGLSLAVIRDGKIIKAEGYGLANSIFARCGCFGAGEKRRSGMCVLFCFWSKERIRL